MDGNLSEWVSEGGVRVILLRGPQRTRLYVYGVDGRMGLAKVFDYWQRRQAVAEAEWLATLLGCVPRQSAVISES